MLLLGIKTDENDVPIFILKFKEAIKKLERHGPSCMYSAILIKHFIEAERSGSWDLCIGTIQQMLSLFHVAEHFIYTKCTHLYIQDMLNLKRRLIRLNTRNSWKMDMLQSGVRPDSSGLVFGLTRP
ncbi:hypothetical protein AVEN_254106-1 [Araneus ventricosus]|uniref:Uncharacterized protein n=1 Tax=Araneus ventricosus TaxID=182803 RepID=A0A4Y2BXX7_ARAVE|nr:hypothetical protein AVEN_254106-1 [Araneus ventricosus]